MTAAGPDRVRDLFLAASAMGDATRERYLGEQCAGDAKLERRVRRMLEHDHGSRTNLLDKPLVPAGALPRNIVEPAAGKELKPGSRLGKFTIECMVGVGGMGVVYRARQDRPARVVAVKVLRAAQATPTMFRRMELEAELLGRLRHPGIAQIYEAGSASDGESDRPYFAMEFIDGTAITEHAAARSLSTRSRVEMMAKVCDAVEHAHQRGVIHRDLKPGNILVDAGGEPKIVDFGVARASDPRLDLTTIRTSIGQLIGTLQYMSPEQIAGDPSKIETRSDVYALGVILYQLLTGKLPYALESASIPQAARIIQESPPTPLSSIDRSLRGELDTIVARTLSKEPSRRYPSAAALGEDLRRYLDGRPIVARADSAMYVLRTQLHRYRGVVAAACVAIIGLSALSSYAFKKANQADEQRTKAEGALAAMRAQATRAERERARADENSAHLREELRDTTIERARLQGLTGNFLGAERTLWQQHRSEASPHTYWALWELYSRGADFRVLPGNHEGGSAVALSPADDLAATTAGTTIRLWNRGDWSAGAELRGHRGPVEFLEFSGDGTLLVSCDTSGCLRTWSMPSGRLIEEMCVPGGTGHAAMARRGMAPWTLALGGNDGVVRTYLVDATGHISTRLAMAARRGEARGMEFDPTGRFLLCGWSDGMVRVYDLDNPRPIFGVRAHQDAVYSVAFSADGSVFSTGSRDGVVYFWRLLGDGSAELVENRELRWGLGSVRAMRFSRDASRMLIAGAWGVMVYDLATLTPAKDQSSVWIGARACEWMEEQESVLALDADGARVWNLRPMQHERSWRVHDGRARAVAASAKEPLFATGSSEGQVRIWNAEDSSPVRAMAGHNGVVWRVRFRPDGKQLASVGADSSIKLWDVSSGRLDREIKVPRGEFLAMDYSPDGARLVGGGRFDRVRVWDTASGSELATMACGPGFVAAAWSPDGSRFATAVGRAVQVWDAATYQRQATLNNEQSGWCVVFLDEDRLAVGGWGSAIQVWDAKRGIAGHLLEGHARLVQGISLGPMLSTGERMLLSCSGDGTIKGWEASSGRNLLTMTPSAGGSVTGVALLSDGSRAVSTQGGGTASVWDLRRYDETILALSKSKASRGGGTLEGDQSLRSERSAQP